MPNFAANLSFIFQEHDFLDRFEAAQRVGFKGVEFLFPYDLAPPGEIAARLNDNGLTQVLFNLGQGNWEAGERGVTALPGRQDDVRRAVDNALRYADALGCRQLHVMAGLVPEGADARAYEDTFAGNLAYVAEALGREGIRALIEPLNTIDNPGYLLSTAGQAQRVIETVGSDNLSLQYDFYHRQVMEGSLAAGFTRHRGIIAHIQVSGVPGRHEPDVGEINYPYLFDMLDAAGYEGWIGCEYRPKAGTLEGLGWLEPYGIGTDLIA